MRIPSKVLRFSFFFLVLRSAALRNATASMRLDAQRFCLSFIFVVLLCSLAFCCLFCRVVCMRIPSKVLRFSFFLVLRSAALRNATATASMRLMHSGFVCLFFSVILLFFYVLLLLLSLWSCCARATSVLFSVGYCDFSFFCIEKCDCDCECAIDAQRFC